MNVIYPGSFDPITLGHVDIVERVASIYPKLTVLIANSDQKNYWFTAEERKQLVAEAVGHIKDVTVDTFDGLTVEYARRHNTRVIIRGLRAISDFELEMSVANINRTLYPEIETLILLAAPEFTFYSSRLVKEVAQFGGDLKTFVSKNVSDAIQKKIKRGSK